MSSDQRDHVPDLQFNAPYCEVCDDGTETIAEEGFYCQKCGTWWDKYGQHGERQES